jgi:hypothetical protein
LHWPPRRYPLDDGVVAADQGAKALAQMQQVRPQRRAGETRSEELLARTIGPLEYNGRSMECNVLLDRIFAGLGERGVGLWKAATETSPKSVENER